MLNRIASYSDTEKKTVMICDDERDLLELFGKALQTRYNVILVGSCEDCIKSSLMKRAGVIKYIPYY
jgi:hypothetical protein